MRTHRMTVIVAAMAMLIGLGHVAATETSTPQYALDLVGDFGPDFTAYAYGINAAGDVVGQVVSNVDPTFSRPWRQLHDRTAPEMLGDVFGVATAINDDGTIVGARQFPDRTQLAFRYSDATGFVDVGSLGGSFVLATAINRRGDVSGLSTLADNFTIHAFRTVGAVLEDLGTPRSGGSVFGYGINDAGQVAGFTIGPVSHAFRFTTGAGLQDIDTLGGDNSGGFGINASGQVAGRAVTDYQNPRWHAFRYTDGIGMVDLMPGRPGGGGQALNDAGDVVGYFVAGTSDVAGEPFHGFLFTDALGLVDLNSYVDPASGWILEYGMAINNTGQIAGFGEMNGVRRSFRLTKDIEPPAILNAESSVSVLWPPNGRIVPVELTAEARDNMDPAPVCRLAAIASSEPDGTPQFEITGPMSATLKADRSGTGPGRTYDLTIVCRDRSGNGAQRIVKVVVPHNQPDQ